MLEKFTYTTHLGEVINFGESPYFASHTDLRDYKWSYDKELTRFNRDTVTKTLEVILVGSEEEADKAKNALYEIIEKDVLAMKKGTFTVQAKDDKGYPYLRLDMKEKYPQITLANKIQNLA